ncbi:TIGR04282 family arsenosugar biosynthesis glycosyltransferase [Aporhodopirellula aestuarii]|uniref:Glycosyltransferase n=1 Tax=Aporhodopirellula aestuarii TaxID=2950107 RepID=A0ABT0U0V0_9BACT|nr:TIGR04282 family arsenosugar biosynthesis glycosyltransferase [Aporhodopirellula aestuarii]MCM2370507.1 glycosyltransferase [Aporhodopirellula aestuarii]
MPPELNQRVLGIMAKYWEAGQVKTRLAGSLPPQPMRPRQSEKSNQQPPESGEDASPMDLAAKVHERFVRHLLTEMSVAGDERQIVGAPVQHLAQFIAVVADGAYGQWQVSDQGAGTLGDRMKNWFAGQLFEPGECDSEKGVQENLTWDKSCVLIGADCPLLSQSDVEEAWLRLEHHEMVIGPAFDGGYYLIGLRPGKRLLHRTPGTRVTPSVLASLFDGIAWSTDSVFEQTHAAAKKAGFRVAVLEPRHDVDTADDLRRLVDELRDLGARGHRLLNDLGGIQLT